MKHKVIFTKCTKDGSMGRTVVKTFTKKINAQRYFNKCLSRDDIWGAQWCYGNTELASSM